MTTDPLGRRIQDGEEVDGDELIGRSCSLLVKTVDRDGSEFNQVEAVMPPATAEGDA